MTRAKKQLYLCGHINNLKTKKPLANSLLEILWPSFRHLFEDITEEITEFDSELVLHQFRFQEPFNVQILREDFVSSNRLEANKKHELIDLSRTTEQARIKGIVIHQVLEVMGRFGSLPTAEKINSMASLVKVRLQQQGIGHLELEALLNQSIAIIQNMLNSQKGRWILNSQHQKIKNEWSLTQRITKESKVQFENYYIDRSFIDENNIRWIIDYKTGDHQGSDLKQFLKNEKLRYFDKMQKYAELVSHLENNHIKIGLYYPALDEFISWDYYKERTFQKND